MCHILKLLNRAKINYWSVFVRKPPYSWGISKKKPLYIQLYTVMWAQGGGAGWLGSFCALIFYIPPSFTWPLPVSVGVVFNMKAHELILVLLLLLVAVENVAGGRYKKERRRGLSLPADPVNTTLSTDTVTNTSTSTTTLPITETATVLTVATTTTYRTTSTTSTSTQITRH